MSERRRVLFVEPFCGGSHRLFAEQYAAFSRHRVETLTLPGSFWKWRMRGGHLSLLTKVRERLGRCDVLLASGMLSLAELLGAVPQLARVTKVVYFHENQMNYPVPQGEAPDVHFGFTNLSTALAADALVFNSRFHLEEFVGGIGRFLKPMPDHRPTRLADEIRPKCAVVHPGIDCEELDRHPGSRAPGGGPPADAFSGGLGLTFLPTLIAYFLARTKSYRAAIFIFSAAYGATAYTSLISEGMSADPSLLLLIYVAPS